MIVTFGTTFDPPVHVEKCGLWLQDSIRLSQLGLLDLRNPKISSVRLEVEVHAEPETVQPERAEGAPMLAEPPQPAHAERSIGPAGRGIDPLSIISDLKEKR